MYFEMLEQATDCFIFMFWIRQRVAVIFLWDSGGGGGGKGATLIMRAGSHDPQGTRA